MKYALLTLYYLAGILTGYLLFKPITINLHPNFDVQL